MKFLTKTPSRRGRRATQSSKIMGLCNISLSFLLFVLLLFCKVSTLHAELNLSSGDSTIANDIAAPIPRQQFFTSDSDTEFLDSSNSAISQISYGRLALVSGLMAASMVSIHIYQENGWWRDNRAPFHFREDLKYGLWVDKIGHFYGASVIAFVASRAFHWSNVSEPTALWLGSGASLTFQTFIEVEDGFSKWGFDRIDFLSNLGGAAWPLARHYLPALQSIDLKFSYHPSPLLNNPGGIGFQGQQHLMMDDYEGQTLWLSAKVERFLPKSVDRYWPDFLCLAVGYGARDIVGDPYSVYFIGLDLDMTKVIPQDTWFLRTLSQALNFIRLPLPAIRVAPTTAVFGFYF